MQAMCLHIKVAELNTPYHHYTLINFANKPTTSLSAATSALAWMRRRSQDFCLGGHPVHFPSSLRGPTAFSGGGGVAEIFRALSYRIGFSGGGGGGSSRNFPCSQLPDQIQWGGG